MDLKVRFKKLSPNAVIPTKKHPTDAGADLTVTSVDYDDAGNTVLGFGIAVEIPEGYVGLLFPRSSIASKYLVMSNSVGIIDSCYRGEIKAKFKPTLINGDCHAEGHDVHVMKDGNPWPPTIAWPVKGATYTIGERAAQLIIMPYPNVEFEEVDELSDSNRGEGGYGSTGK